MQNDKSYENLVKKLKSSKSDRKRFIKLVDGVKETHKKINKLNSKGSKETSKTFGRLVVTLNKAIKDSK